MHHLPRAGGEVRVCPRVEQAVPLIFTKERLPPPLPIWVRGLNGLLMFAFLTVLGIGAWLNPARNPNGAGISTHTQLGLQKCQFEERTGLPCPSCGYTTSVSWFAHGNPLASLYVQPMGFVVALSVSCGVWLCGYVALTGRPVYRLMTFIPGRYWLWTLLTIALGGWGWKIWIHLTGRDYWS